MAMLGFYCLKIAEGYCILLWIISSLKPDIARFWNAGGRTGTKVTEGT